ncbi:methyltransferase domain-containing protein [Prochlorococcus marinus]
MGLLKHHIHTLCMEQKKTGFIKGKVLTLGQQSVWINSLQSSKIFKNYNLKKWNLKENIDYRNNNKYFKNTSKENNLSCKALLTIMGADNVEAMDISDYEGADIIHNLNNPISKSLFEQYDAIIDSGTLEHIFDTPTALKNICDMLKPDGSLFLAYPCSNSIDHGFYSFSPTLFFDFFEANGFTNLSAYLHEGSPRLYERKGRLFKYKHTCKEIPIVSSRGIELIFFAQKSKEYKSDNLRKPIQLIYNERKYEKDEENLNSIKSKNLFSKRLILFLKNISLNILLYLPYEFERICFNMIRRNKIIKYIGRF